MGFFKKSSYYYTQKIRKFVRFYLVLKIMGNYKHVYGGMQMYNFDGLLISMYIIKGTKGDRFGTETN